MDYAKLSDMEINLLVASYTHPKKEIYPHPRNSNAAAIELPFRQLKCFMPVQRSEDGYDIARINRIAIVPQGKTRWMAYHECGASHTDRKPLRAAMIVFLKLMESKEENNE